MNTKYTISLVRPVQGPPQRDKQEDWAELLAGVDHNDNMTIFYETSEDKAREILEYNRHNILDVTMYADNGHEAPEFLALVPGADVSNKLFADMCPAGFVPDWVKKLFGIY